MSILNNEYLIAGVVAIVTYVCLYFYYKNRNANISEKDKKQQMMYNILISLCLGLVVFLVMHNMNKKKLNVLSVNMKGGNNPVNKSGINLPNNDVFNDIYHDIM